MILVFFQMYVIFLLDDLCFWIIIQQSCLKSLHLIFFFDDVSNNGNVAAEVMQLE